MAAYLIADIRVKDPAEFAAYGALATAVVERHGGRYLVRGGQVTRKEGDWSPSRLVVLEFDSMDAARAFYESDEYQAILGRRQRSADSDLVFVEGAG
jgi:uncharacterized protein (DUF1330 family)